MPELPDILIYVQALRDRIGPGPLVRCRISGPSLVRTYDPPVDALEGLSVLHIDHQGKRLVFELTDEHFLVLHLMIAGRLRWEAAGASIPRRGGLAAFDFASGSLLLIESAIRKRAALHVLRGRAALRDHDPGGIDVLECDADAFSRTLRSVRRTLKRALTDPRLFCGIGNAYSDEILHRARLSPFLRSAGLSDEQCVRLHEATRSTLVESIERRRADVNDGFPSPRSVTAFRPEFAVHGKFGEPCPVCGTKVQRIRYASNETNYCPKCQTEGRVLADRSLSRLLKDDWPGAI
ncbi:MAG: formamidopyrimidine-DNA glycosylase [Phycisphaeraceae bacterium]|nr:formamidopyrimidine-DNA glycosylase [Phycisphaeraceae bacterium]